MRLSFSLRNLLIRQKRCRAEQSKMPRWPRQFLPVRLTVSIPAPPHLFVGGVISELAKKYIGLELFNMSVSKRHVPDAQMPFRHDLASLFSLGPVIVSGEPKVRRKV